ncbi:hypothetical protein ACFQJC_14415 [Haloferax namakaokahaiae]|uniref:DUF7389 domain-containing protein n=1 Tax=Haloferax namakaokahaiae TaxID=1748331 RepID=A0ABD5ZHM4_9EURY
MSDEFETKIVVTRGSGTNDREKFTTKVTAPTIDILNDRVEQVRQSVEKWAEDFRAIQPDGRKSRGLTNDQSTLTEAES